MEEDKTICSLCESEVQKDDDFCTNCGTLMTEFVKCVNHSDKTACGVCVICCEPFCEECGAFVTEVFFCTKHSEYNFMEGMVNLFCTKDAPQMELLRNELEERGMHPLIFSERIGEKNSRVLKYNSPDSITPYELLTDQGQVLMVPFQEVIYAENVLRELEIIE